LDGGEVGIPPPALELAQQDGGRLEGTVGAQLWPSVA
jgi:hypothetical protein